MKKLFFAPLIMLGLFVAVGLIIPEQIALWAMQAERASSGLEYKTVPVDGETWHYLEGGPEDAETVLMLHGFGAEKDHWVRFAGHITDRYHVVAPDLPGFGESARHESWDYSLPAQRERLAAFAQALELERFHLVGNSMGGHLTALYTYKYPQQVITMGLFNNAGVASSTPSEFEELQKEGKNPLLLQSPDEFDRMMEFAAHKQPFVPWPVKGVMAEKAYANSDFNAYIFKQYKADRSAGLEDKLPTIKTPTQILWGRHDRLIHVSAIETMRPLLPQAEVVIMEDTGHIPMVERPAQTAEHYLNFIDKHD